MRLRSVERVRGRPVNPSSVTLDAPAHKGVSERVVTAPHKIKIDLNATNAEYY